MTARPRPWPRRWKKPCEKRRGVCQDFAHLAIASSGRWGCCPLRQRLPAHPPPRARTVDGRRRLARLVFGFLPSFGWVDFDPTNNLMPGTDHITLAYGRDFGDVSPVSGILTGGGKTRRQSRGDRDRPMNRRPLANTASHAVRLSLPGADSFNDARLKPPSDEHQTLESYSI